MKRVFLAGASGVIGRRLLPLLAADGWVVFGTTRSAANADDLRALGATPVVVDVFDAPALERALADARPQVVVHQLTDLPDGLDPARIAEALPRNARIRDLGTRNLVAAAVAAGARRLVAQSIAFAYAPGEKPYREDAPLNVQAAGTAGITARGVESLERQVLEAPLEAIVLRYGRLYGPGTGVARPPEGGPLHVDAAAHAALLAMTRGSRGVYNVAEEDGTVASEKARAELGWRSIES